MNYSIERANEFIKNNDINEKYYPKLNYAAPVGWLNDPNGVSFFNGKYHLFYQYYPYDSKWGPMHWGHSISEDGINWDDQGVALAPDQSYDKDGCFSGSAIEKDGKLYLMYTGHLDNGSEFLKRENQNIAVSEDGVNFVKYENNPVIDEKLLPEGTAVQDFRDPKLFEKDGLYYCIIGARDTENSGQVLLYKSHDLFEWEFVSVVLEKSKYLGSMAECPDIMFFEDRVVLVISAMDYHDNRTNKTYPHLTLMLEGKFDWETYKFEVNDTRVMDYGLDFYAPQSARESSGKYLFTAWNQAWNRTYPTDVYRHGWNGQMTVPRQLYEQDGLLKQSFHPKVLDKIESLYQSEKALVEDIKLNELNNIQYLSFEIDSKDSFKFEFGNNTNEKHIYLTFMENKIIFSRENTDEIIYDAEGREVSQSEMMLSDELSEVKFDILLDRSSIQIIVNNYDAMSSTFYLDLPINQIKYSTNNSNSMLTNILVGTFNK